MDLLEIQTATPAEIDTHYAPIWAEYLRALQDRRRAEGIILRSKQNVARVAVAGRRATVSAGEVSQARRTVERAEAVIAKLGPQIDRYNTEWSTRGGWPQVWLCTSSDNGHYHRGKHCGSLRWDSEIGLIPMFSGLTEDEIVEAIGSDACTRCYPSAPVDKPSTRGPLFESRAAEAEAKAKRDAELAAKRAKAAAKAITAPDGSPLRDEFGGEIRTERTAQMYYVEAAADAITWADPRMIEQYPQNWAANSARAAEYSLRLLAALAHKNNETRNQAQARLESKVQAKVRAYWK
jgi:hypothetical protein